jgi:beta-glucanase (GH16 family)
MTKLTFDDEFNSLSLYNGTNGTWQPAYDWSPNGFNAGSSWLVNPAVMPADANIYSVSNGTLSMAIKPLPADVSSASVGGDQFLSGQLETKPSFSQEYGYFEINAQLPSGGAGISSAFWLLPESGAWPPEIDVFEEDTSQGTNAVETGVFSNQTGSTQQIYNWNYNLPDLSAAAHTFAVDWEPNTITWYIDGQQVFQTATPADMHQPMYMLIDDLTSAPGSWNGSPVAGLNTSMKVNWVHDYDSNPYVNGVNTVLGGTAAPPVQPAPVTTGTGSDALVLKISEDAYLGDAQFTVSVDGKQLGGTFTASASHAAGIDQLFTFNGDWAPGAHAVTVDFLNDAWGGSSAADRNLYVDGISYDGTATGQSAELAGTGPQNFSVTDTTAIPSAASPPITTGTGSDTLVLGISEDAYQGDAQFTVSVDGKQLGGTFTTTASHASGVVQNFTFKGDWAPGAHAVVVNFLNDAYGGTAATDRNLYVNSIGYDGTNTNQSAELAGTGPKSFRDHGSGRLRHDDRRRHDRATPAPGAGQHGHRVRHAGAQHLG